MFYEQIASNGLQAKRKSRAVSISRASRTEGERAKKQQKRVGALAIFVCPWCMQEGEYSTYTGGRKRERGGEGVFSCSILDRTRFAKPCDCWEGRGARVEERKEEKKTRFSRLLEVLCVSAFRLRLLISNNSGNPEKWKGRMAR